MKLSLLAIAAIVALPAAAQPSTSNDQTVETIAERNTPAATLAAYRAALETRDAEAMQSLFAESSLIFENGKAEGSFDDYLAHHLGPELHAIESFTFSDPTLEVEQHGEVAIAHETYGYAIALSDGRRIERLGVATSVLVQEDSDWKILRYHSSSRTPR